jgi:hypothetical protein
MVPVRISTASSSWKFKAHLARNTAQEAPSPGAGGVRASGSGVRHYAAPGGLMLGLTEAVQELLTAFK